MKIYFAASIAGGRKFSETYKLIVNHLISRNHIVLTEHIIYDDVIEIESKFTPAMIYERDLQFLKACDVVIAEISNPSLGVGYEICYAEHLQKPIFCLYRDDIYVSRMIIGNSSHLITFAKYNNTAQMFSCIDKFLMQVK